MESLVVSVAGFFSQKEVLGLCTGLLIGSGLRGFWSLLAEWRSDQRSLRFIEDSLLINRAIVEKNIELVGKEIAKLPAISTLEPLQELIPSGAELLLSGQVRYRALWLSLKKIDCLSGQIRALSNEIFEIKRTIKGETRSEVLRVELIPYLKDFNTLTIMRLTELGMECKRASSMLVPKEKKK